MTTTGVSTDSKNQIAIIYAQGEIQSGEGDVNTIEGSMRRSLQEARRNKDVKAIVLRIDSPGGSAYIRFNLRTGTHKKVKPIVVSINYAASRILYCV
jgi:protease-4